jgi:hypothetical protein
MNNQTDDANDLLATPERAIEIASQEQIGLLEFTELTGVGAGRFGPYRIDESGVNVDHVPLAELPPREQISVQRAKRAHTLSFPCSPESFGDWYQATRATNGVSDFPLAPAFGAEMRRRVAASSVADRPTYPSDAIVRAFTVRPGASSNKSWWDARLRDPGKYHLETARACKGKAKIPSRWYPDVVGGWLIDKGHMTRGPVVAAVTKNFPDVDVNLI